MRTLAGSLADGELADAILIPLRPLIIKEGKGSEKKVRKLVTKFFFTSN